MALTPVQEANLPLWDNPEHIFARLGCLYLKLNHPSRQAPDIEQDFLLAAPYLIN
jgi:hypothetical protein